MCVWVVTAGAGRGWWRWQPRLPWVALRGGHGRTTGLPRAATAAHFFSCCSLPTEANTRHYCCYVFSFPARSRVQERENKIEVMQRDFMEASGNGGATAVVSSSSMQQ